MGEAISFLFQRTLAFSDFHRGMRSYFIFSAANLGIIGGLLALGQATGTIMATKRSDADQRSFSSGNGKGRESQDGLPSAKKCTTSINRALFHHFHSCIT